MSNPASSLDQIRDNVQAYVVEQYLREAYDDHISGYRTRVWEPQWPPRSNNHESDTALDKLRPLEESRETLERALEPVLAWIRLSNEECQAEHAGILQSQVLALLNRQSWSDNVRARRHNSEGKSFLYRNLPDAGVELNIFQLINRIHVLVQQNDIFTAQPLVEQALSLSEALNYSPIRAKCWFWAGVVADLGLNDADAAIAFTYALPCFGRFMESASLPFYVRKYQDKIASLIEAESGDDSIREQENEQLQIVMTSNIQFPSRGHGPSSQIDRQSDAPDDRSANDSGENTPTPDNVRPLSMSSEQSSLFESLLRQTLAEEAEDDVTSQDDRGSSTTGHNDFVKPLPSPRRVGLDKEEVLELYNTLSPEDQRISNMEAFIDGLDNDPENEATIAHRIIALKAAAEKASEDDRENQNSKSGSENCRTESHLDTDSSDHSSQPQQSRVKRMLEEKINEVELNEMVANQNALRADRIKEKYEKHPRLSIGAARAWVRRDELTELRARFGQNVRDPHGQAYLDIISADPDANVRSRIIRTPKELERLAEQGWKAELQYFRDERGRMLEGRERGRAQPGATPRRRSVSEEGALSDTPALEQMPTRAYPHALMIPRRRSSMHKVPESPTHMSTEPVSPSPLRKASLPGDQMDEERQ